MFIETDRLMIRNLETEDGIIFAGMAADSSLDEIWIDRVGPDWMEEWMTEARQLAARDDPSAGYLAYTMERRDTHEVIGSVGCTYYEDLEKVGIAYFVGAEYRGHGYAAEAIKAYVQYYLQHTGQGEIIAGIREDNVPSWRAAEKAGFVLTEQKLYQDMGDASELMYRFYVYRRGM